MRREFGEGKLSAALRVNGDLRPFLTDIPADAIFPIYSITKTLTAILVLRLVEIGAVSLDVAAKAWLPELNIPSSITLTHLLRHTSGLRDYGPLPEYHEAVRSQPGKPWTRQQFLDAVLEKEILFLPGEQFAYSNIGYMLLIDIIERVTGQTFARVLDDFVIRPLTLQRTSVLEQVDDLMRCVPGYGREVTADGHVIDVRGHYHPGWCAPRLVASTAEDITRVFDTLIAGNLLTADALAQMLTLLPLSKEPGESIAGGIGVYSDRSSRWGRNYHHGGGGPGYDLAVTVYPDTALGRVSVAAFVNSSCSKTAEDFVAVLMARLLDV